MQLLLNIVQEHIAFLFGVLEWLCILHYGHKTDDVDN